MLSHRNYTASELVSEIQTKLNSLKSTSDLVDWKNLDGVTLTEDGGNILKSTETPYTGDRGDRVAIFFKTTLDLTKDSSAVSLLDGLVGSNQVKTEIEKISEQPASGFLYYQSSKLFTYTSPIDSTITGTFQIGCRNTADDLQEIFYIASVPRFKVSLSSSGKIVVKRVDVFGYLPNTTSAGAHLNFADGVFVITPGLKNPIHLGTNRPTRINEIPTDDQMYRDEGDAYNWNGTNTSVQRAGSVMRSHRQVTEFGTILSNMENTTTQRETVQTIYFPNVSNVNCQNTVIVRTNLRGHIQDNGKRCNILSKIPVNVNQDDVLFYKPENPFRANLGQGNSVSRIDIRLTDRDDNILDFNGVPNEIGLLVFEVFDVVSIPIIRHNEHRIPTDKQTSPPPILAKSTIMETERVLVALSKLTR